jgi:hypothetical protein
MSRKHDHPTLIYPARSIFVVAAGMHAEQLPADISGERSDNG